MRAAFPESRRMRAVQSPVIPVVGELIRRHPGTISLGQGVVYYGPPPQAVGQVSQFLADPDNHKYQAGARHPAADGAVLARSWREENGDRGRRRRGGWW